MKNCLITSLHDIELQVKIGVGAEERINPQPIKISFALYQAQLPEVTNDDNSSDFLCYASLASFIYHYCTSNEFRTIEYLCFQIHKQLKQQLGDLVLVKVIVKKCKPEMDLITGGSSCEFYG